MRRTLLISFLSCFCAMTVSAVPAPAGVAAPSAPARAAAPRGPAPDAASGPRAGDAAALGEAVRTARADLLRIPGEDMDPDVTPAMQRGIERLKDRIIAFANATLASSPAGASPSAIQQALAARGDAFEDRNVYTEHNPPPARHGNGLSYEVRPIAGHPDMVGVVATISIICGSDAVLILYARDRSGWRPLLIRRSAPYRQISGANGDLRYAVSPPDARGRWYVATSRVPPWCTSAWSTLYYDLSRPGPTPEAPTVFFRRAADLYFGFDDSGRLNAGANRLQVLHDGGIFDAGVLVRRYVETYAVDGDHVRRIAPFAFNARDFVDEWLDMDWGEAAAMSGPGLAETHRTLKAPRDGTNRYFELGAIRGCGGGRQQVEIEDSGQRIWYLLVSGNGHGVWRMERVAQAPIAGCGGPDLAPAIQRAEDARRGISRG